jgi:hypothetical protein
LLLFLSIEGQRKSCARGEKIWEEGEEGCVNGRSEFVEGERDEEGGEGGEYESLSSLPLLFLLSLLKESFFLRV